jgi:predicted PurR-regulated permease PerM
MSDSQGRIKIEGTIREKLISWVMLIIIFIALWHLLDIVLLTFIITFIFYHLLKVIQRRFRRLVQFTIPDPLILAFLYIIFIFLLVILSYELFPKVVGQCVEIGNSLIQFNVADLEEILDPRLYTVVENLDPNTYLTQAGSLLAQGITSISIFGLNLFISVILSLLLLLEKGRICNFGLKMANSRISFIYEYLTSFGASFANTFGKVMRVQLTIATINAIISMLVLTLMGFPQILGLGTMIFFLGLIPVAGVIISLFPLCIIAFNVGGISKVIGVILMISIIHAIEAYILNPKLMSDKTELPVCFVFIILLMAEHYMGVWGLLIGVPIFIFLMNVLEVDCSEPEKCRKKKQIKKQKNKRE